MNNAHIETTMAYAGSVLDASLNAIEALDQTSVEVDPDLPIKLKLAMLDKALANESQYARGLRNAAIQAVEWASTLTWNCDQALRVGKKFVRSGKPGSGEGHWE